MNGYAALLPVYAARACLFFRQQIITAIFGINRFLEGDPVHCFFATNTILSMKKLFDKYFDPNPVQIKVVSRGLGMEGSWMALLGQTHTPTHPIPEEADYGNRKTLALVA